MWTPQNPSLLHRSIARSSLGVVFSLTQPLTRTWPEDKAFTHPPELQSNLDQRPLPTSKMEPSLPFLILSTCPLWDCAYTLQQKETPLHTACFCA